MAINNLQLEKLVKLALYFKGKTNHSKLYTRLRKRIFKYAFYYNHKGLIT